MFSKHTEGKSVVAEQFNRTLGNKIYTAILKNTYINKIFKLINEYDNIIHRTIDSSLRLSSY